MLRKADRIEVFFKILFFSTVVYFPLFLHLENLPLRIWDEARLAVSAYEMSNNGNYIVVHFNGNPDMWSTKPPLMIWLQVLCLRIFGVNELAIRLPAAIAALFTCVSILLFAIRFLKSYWFGMLAVMILVTAGGYIDLHVTRTGDYESLLVLNTTLYALFFFLFIETDKLKFLYLTILFLILAALTKGVAALLFLPALFLYALLRGKLLQVLKTPHLYAGILLFAVFAGGYYLLREHLNPGYLDAIKENELGGRYLQTLEGHQHPYWIYFSNLTGNHFSPWHLFVPVGMLFGIFHKQTIIRNLSLYSALIVVVYFFIISGAQTRIFWYDAPMFPFLSLLAAVFFWYWFDWLSSTKIFAHQLQKNVVPAAFVFLVFVIPYSKIIDKVYKPKEEEWVKEYSFMRHLQKGLQGMKDLNNHLVCYGNGKTPAMFYVHAMQDKGVKIDFADYKKLRAGVIAMAFQPEIKREIERRYETVVIEEENNVKVYRIKTAYDCSE